jgi:hypothetical protein
LSAATDSAVLPAGARVRRVAFVSERPSAPLAELPPPIGRYAIEVPDGFTGAGARAGAALQVLTVPTSEAEDAEALEVARAWAEARGPAQLVALHGAQLLWGTGRAAVLAAPDRLDGATRALLESAFCDAELRHIETALGALWPDLESDGPRAFEFGAPALRERRKLAERFRAVLELRARLARLSPLIHLPPVFPPTLASQIGERLRERARMAHRAESLEGQLEVFERIYDGCAQRASEYVHARRSHALEWVIIFLLLAQTVFVCIDQLGGTTASGQ